MAVQTAKELEVYKLAEYDVMIAAANVIAILQAEARQRLVWESA